MNQKCRAGGFALLMGLALFVCLTLRAQEGTGPQNEVLGMGRDYGRSMVISQGGIAAW